MSVDNCQYLNMVVVEIQRMQMNNEVASYLHWTRYQICKITFYVFMGLRGRTMNKLSHYSHLVSFIP